MNRTWTLVYFAAVAVGCSQVTPKHDIPVRPDYIHAGVQVGDTVEITTSDGKRRTIEVSNVGANTIDSAEESISFGDIAKIVKRSWKEPGHPCGGRMPVGCSIPEVVLILSSDYQQQADKFHPACVTHDFCYRHGAATYGAAREQCDDDFYIDMKLACKGTANLGVFDLKEYSICQLAANQTYEAVQRHGEAYFKITTSTYCEYQVVP